MAVRQPIELHFESRVDAPPEAVWRWITSAHGISSELWPYLRMSMPRGVRSLTDVELVPGRPLFRSRLFLFGFLPYGFSDLTLLELAEPEGFVEQSPMTLMRLWRHERRIRPAPDGRGALVSDHLTFDPRGLRALTRWFIGRVFAHRHAVLRREVPRTPRAGRLPSGAP